MPTFTLDGLRLLGFPWEEKAWECLKSMSRNTEDGGGFRPTTKLKVGEDNAFFGFINHLMNFSFEKTAFYTVDGRVGGGTTGTETGGPVDLIHGCSLPVLLREVEGKLRDVGACYIPGLSGVDRYFSDSQRE